MSVTVADALSFKIADEYRRIHQLLTPEGEVIGPIPDLPETQMLDYYRWMVYGRIYSDRMVALQRQGRMGTFAPINGQEAASVGMVAPLLTDDWLVASYREGLSYMVKGVPTLTIMKQWGGYVADDYPRQANCLPFQVVLGTQMLHAVGVGQAIKLNRQPHVVVTACGDGATSEGDFNEALNFAGVLKAPVIFIVQNNGWAISTPREQQTAAAYIADRGPGFGIPSRVVDGNDFFAVYDAVAEAIERARAGEGPTLIEALTYRLSAHTTADDPTKYRSEAEVESWQARDPLLRFRTFLLDRGLLTEVEADQLRETVAAEIQTVIDTYESLPAPDPRRLFRIVYDRPTPQLRRQERHLLSELGLAA